ncbi:MAG: glycosyltransferase [Candidatus Krumholzibacteriia bacterium]
MFDPRGAWLPRRWRGSGLGRTAAGALASPRHRDPATGALEVPYVKGACLLTTREVWQRTGPLDERFFLYFEETDWCHRARAGGGRVYLCPDVQVRHLEGQATGQVSEFSLRQFQHSYRLYLRKHQGEAAVRCVRRAQAFEYRWKAWWRGRSRRPADRALAARYRAIARLQDMDDVAPDRPR